MELVFNELSTDNSNGNKKEANQKVVSLIKCFKASLSSGFQKIRFSCQFHEIEIANDYTLKDWLNETDQRNYKDILLGAFRYPFVNPEDVWAEDQYITHRFYFKENNIKTYCPGLAAAHIYHTLAISFTGRPEFEKNQLGIVKESDDAEDIENITIHNVFSADCFQNQCIKVFIEQVTELVLIPSGIDPLKKVIKLRDDHGKDTLTEFAKKLCQNNYVVGITNSIPYNRFNSNFIRRTYPDGIIELVLYWTDEGLGLVVKTTGRNLRETREIADILKNEFSRQT